MKILDSIQEWSTHMYAYREKEEKTVHWKLLKKKNDKEKRCHLKYVGDSALFNSGIAETLAMDK